MKPKVISPLIPEVTKMKKMLRKLNLHTVCEEALCPNIGECFKRRTATFLIMGDVCTRACVYCDIKTGKPLSLDPKEPENIAKAVKELNLRHVVITSVTRDDLPDGGAEHFSNVIKEIKKTSPNCIIEVLIPDFNGKKESLLKIIEQNPDIINHNLETVKRLFPIIRHRGNYDRSLKILKWVKEISPNILTKSGIMVGLGEKIDEVFSLMEDLINVECDIFTVGQYLQPSKENFPVKKYYTKDEFKEIEERGRKLGFKYIYVGELIRSSYNADYVFQKSIS
ncbi:lipoyl synthase [Persephonella sp.]